MTALKKFFLSMAVSAGLALTLATPCRADSSSLEQAEKLFQSGDWEKARQAFKAELAATPDASNLPPAFFYDYGTALARAGATGEAYVSLLRAAFAMPFDSDTKHNLRLVEGQVPASVRSVQPASWFAWWPSGLRMLPWKLWIALGLLCSAAALALIRLADRSLSIGAAVLAALLLLWGGLAWSQARFSVYGVVALAKVKSGPASTFSDITTLEPGSLVTEETTKESWLKIRFQKPESDEEIVGWVEPTSVLKVY